MKNVTISRRKVQLALGLLWLLDGFLQLQPKMFTKDFVTQVISPAQSGQPFYFYDPIQFASKIFLLHPAIFNSFIAITQISIGLLILYKLTAKFGLWLSVIWGLFVWYIGEAAAGMFSGQSSLLMGLPGAALLYALIALAVLPRSQDDKKWADSWLAFIWAALWILGAIFQLLPAQNSINSLKSMILANAIGAPGWLASLDIHSGNLLNHLGASQQMSGMAMSSSAGYLPILLLSLIMFFIGIGVFLRRSFRLTAIILGILLSALFWFIGQGLGGYYTGVMTDVQTAPLLILAGLAIIGQPDLSYRLKDFYGKLERMLV